MTSLDDKDLPFRGGKWHDAFDAWHGVVEFVAKALQCSGLEKDFLSDDDTQDTNAPNQIIKQRKVYRTRDRNDIASLSTDLNVSGTTVVDFQRQKAARRKQPPSSEWMDCFEGSNLFSDDLSVILPNCLNDSGTEFASQNTPEALIGFEVNWNGLFSEEWGVFNQIPKLNDSGAEDTLHTSSDVFNGCDVSD
jgi:hypothetical protein